MIVLAPFWNIFKCQLSLICLWNCLEVFDYFQVSSCSFLGCCCSCCNVELHSQSRRSSMTFGPIASKCFNISSQSKRAILKIFLTFVTFDQPEYRGMSTACFRVSPLGGWVRCQSNCRTAPKVYERVTLSSGGVSEVKKVQDWSSWPTTSVFGEELSIIIRRTAKLHFIIKYSGITDYDR